MVSILCKRHTINTCRLLTENASLSVRDLDSESALIVATEELNHSATSHRDLDTSSVATTIIKHCHLPGVTLSRDEHCISFPATIDLL